MIAGKDGVVEAIAPHATQAPAGAIVVADPQLLFHGDFRRAGADLILSKDGHELLVPDYFRGEKRAALASPDGAHLSGAIVEALTGHTQYAQAGGSSSPGAVIGHVTKLAGTATVTRNGVAILLHLGDNVEKGDVVASGSDSTLGITFIDGTVFGLSSNARMVLNEMIYDPNGSNNSSLLSLVAGTISFVAGQTAKHGDMKVDTPVATMGIRGTAVLVEIDFSVPGQGTLPAAHFQVLVEPDGTTGSYTLYDKTTLAPIATVNQAGQQINIVQGQVSITNAPLSTDQQKLITDVFTLKFTDNSNPNPKTTTAENNSITPQTLNPIKLADNTTATPIVVNVGTFQQPVTTGSTPTSISHSTDTLNVIPYLNLPPSLVVNGAILAHAGVTSHAAVDTVSNSINFVDPNAGDTPTVSIQFASFAYQNAAHQEITGSLTALQKADIAALEASLVVVPAPGNTNNGSATWTYSVEDSALGFLAGGETLTLTYLATVNNHHEPNPQTAVAPFTITLTGSNAAPVITSAAQNAAIAVAASSNSAMPDTANGTVTFTDANLSDTHVVTVTGVTASGVTSGLNDTTALGWLTLTPQSDSSDGATGADAWTFSAADKNFGYLAAGEQLVLTYTVQVDDGHGGVVTTPVTITVTGTNDAPVITSSAQLAVITESAVPNLATPDIASGHVSFTDANLSDTHVVKVTGVSASGVTTGLNTATALGWLTLTAQSDSTDGATGSDAWTFSAADKFFDYLAAGQQLVLTYTVQVSDGHGGIVTTPVAITVTGTDDAPVINPPATPDPGPIKLPAGALDGVGGYVPVVYSNDLTFSDPDLSDSHTVSYAFDSSLSNLGGWLTAPIGEFAVSLVHDSTGGNPGDVQWTFTLNSSDLTKLDTANLLPVGSKIVEVYDVTVDDGHGGTVTRDVSIEIDGPAGPTEPFVWASDVSGSWSNPAGWNNAGLIPGTTDQVRISYSDITVTVSSAVTVATLSSAATLDIASGDSLSITDATGNSSNTGTIDIYGTLTLNGGTLNGNPRGEQAGSIVVETGGTLTVDGATINGAAVTIGNASEPAAPLLLDDGAALVGGTLKINSFVEIEHGASGPGATLDGVTITVNDDASIDVDLNTLGAVLTLDDGTAISGGFIKINSLQGKLDIERGAFGPGATLDNVEILNSGIVQVDAAFTSTSILKLEDGTAIVGGMLTIGFGSTLDIAHGADDLGAALEGVSVSNYGLMQIDSVGQDLTLTLESGGIISGGELSIGTDDTLKIGPGLVNIPGATLNDVTVIAADPSGTITLTADSALTLNGAEITGASIDFMGAGSDIDVTGSSTINGGASLNNGYVSVESGQTLTLDHVTVAGTVFNLYGFGDTLRISQPSSFNGTIAGLANGDAIDLTTVSYSSDEYSVWTQTSTSNGGAGTLLIYDGDALEATLSLAGIYSQGDFALSDDQTASHGTDLNIANVDVNHVSFSGGVINTNYNYVPQISQGASTLQLTDGNGSEAASWFASTPHSIASFTASFDYQANAGADPADGLAFILQNSTAGVQALGSSGGDLGYGGAFPITPSAAIEFNLYGYYGRGTAFETNGVTGSGGSIYQSTGEVSFWNGDAMHVVVSYNGSVLTEALTDLVNGDTYTAHYSVNLASILQGSTAFIGFSAATGAAVSAQTVSNFTFTNALNGTPVISLPDTAPTLPVDQAATISGFSLSEAGNIAGEIFTVTLADSHGQLSTTAVGDGDKVTVSAAGTALTIIGSLGDINSDLSRLTDTNADAGSDAITVTATDSLGQSAIPQTLAVTVNDVPVIAVPAATPTIAVGQAATISGLSLSETGNTSGEIFTVKLADSHGQLSTTVVGDGDTVTSAGTELTIIGSLADINSDLSRLTDTNAHAGSDPITMTAIDSLGQSAGSQTVAVTVNTVPVIAVPATPPSIAVGEVAALSGISLSEPGNVSGEIFTVKLADSHGQLSTTAVGDGDTVTSAGTELTIIGSLADINSDLSRLTDTNPHVGSDPITVAATDSLGQSTVPQTIAVTEKDVPIITSVQAPTLIFDDIVSSTNAGENGYAAATFISGTLYVAENFGTGDASNPSSFIPDGFNLLAINPATGSLANPAWQLQLPDEDFFARALAIGGSTLFVAGNNRTGENDDLPSSVGTLTAFSLGPNGAAGPALFTVTEPATYVSQVVVDTSSGSPHAYAIGTMLVDGYNGLTINEYDSSGKLLHSITLADSSAKDAVMWNGNLWVVGNSYNEDTGFGAAPLWEFDPSLDLINTFAGPYNIGFGSPGYAAEAVSGSALYAVGDNYTNSTTDQFLITKFDSSGDVVWSDSFGGAGENFLQGVTVTADGRLFAVGGTIVDGNEHDLLIEVDPNTGAVISETNLGDNARLLNLGTDGQNLFGPGAKLQNGVYQGLIQTFSTAGTVGPVAAAVTEDQTPTATGKLSAIDPAGDPITWQVAGGTNSAASAFSFSLDDFSIAVAGTVIANGALSSASIDGGSGPPLYYFYGAGLAGANGSVTFNAANAAFVQGVDAGAPPYIANIAGILPDFSPGGAGALTQASPFTISARFELTLPTEIGASYGIALDNNFGSTQLGDILQLVVTKQLNGTDVVELRDQDFATQTFTVIASAELAATAGDGQIDLVLSHAAGSQVVAGSFDLVSDGAAGPGVTLSGVDTFFSGHSGAYSNQNLAQAEILAEAPQSTYSYLNGTYGTLAVDLQGQWTYALHNNQANVEALADGQTVDDSFVVQASNGQGGVASQTITIAVTGNHSPILTWAPTVSGNEDGSIALGSLAETISGPAGSSADSLTIGGAPQDVVLSDGQGHSAVSDGRTEIDVSTWNLSSLTVDSSGAAVPDGDFTLTATATEQDGNGNISKPVTATELVMINLPPPTLTPTAETGGEYQPIAINLGITIHGLAGDSNSLGSLVLSAIPIGATLSDGKGNFFTATEAATSVDIHAWNLSTLMIGNASTGTFTLGVTAAEQNADGNLSAVTTTTNLLSVNGLPEITAPASQAIGLGQDSAIKGISLAESGDTSGEIFTVTLTGGQLTTTAVGDGDTVNFSAAGNQLTINGSLSDVNSDLSRLTDTHPNLGPDPIAINVTDSLGQSAFQMLLVTAGGPLFSGAGTTVLYPDAAVDLDPAIAVSDLATTIAGVTVSISSGYQTGDQLLINGQSEGTYFIDNLGSVQFHYDSTTHAMVLSVAAGSPTAADFNAALQSIQYTTIGNDPTAEGTDTSRTITWTAQDSAGQSSAAATTTVSLAAIVEWINPSGGNWFVAANWSNGVPTAATDALIDLPVTVTLDHNGTSAFALVDVRAGATLLVQNNLVSNTGDGSAVFADGGSIDFQDNGILNAGTLEATGTGGLDIINTTVDNSNGVIDAAGGNVDLHGIAISGGILMTSAGSTSDIVITGSSTINGGAAFYGANVTLDSGQTLILDDVTAIGTRFNDIAAGSLIRVDSNAMLSLSGVSITGGSFTNAGEVDVEGVTTFATANPITNSGRLVVTGGAILEVRAAEIDDTGTGSADGLVIGNAAVLHLDNASGLKLAGHGVVGLNAGSDITGNPANPDEVSTAPVRALDNVDNFIFGSGEIGRGSVAFGERAIGSLDLVNEAAGTIEARGGTLTINTGNAITNRGLIEAGAGSRLVIDDAVAGTGAETIADGATLQLKAAVASTQTVTFSGAGTLYLGRPSSFSGRIAGLSGDDLLDLAGFDPTTMKVTASAYSDGITTLSVADGFSHSAVLTLVGDYQAAGFRLASDGNGGTLLLLNQEPSIAVTALSNRDDTAATSQVYLAQGAVISSTTGDGLLIGNADRNASDLIVAELNQTSSINVSAADDGGVVVHTASSASAASIAVFNAAAVIASGSGDIGIYAGANGKVTVGDAGNVSGARFGIEANELSPTVVADVDVSIGPHAIIASTASSSSPGYNGDGIRAVNNGAGDIIVALSPGDQVNSVGSGIDAVNVATAAPASDQSTIVVDASGTIDSGSVATGAGNPPAGIVAGYFGSDGSTDPAIYPMPGLYGDVTVNNSADIVAAAGDGIHAYDYGTGDVTINDLAGTITALGGSDPVDDSGNGLVAYNDGPGDIDIYAAAGTVIEAGGSGIRANNADAAVPASSAIVIVAYGTIMPGQISSGDGNPPAGILAGYESSGKAADDNVLGNVTIDDYASISAPAGTDGIRGYNYGIGTVIVTVETEAVITAGRYGLAARGHDGGDVSVINYGSVTAPTAINANTTGSGTIDIDNHGTISGAIVVGDAASTDAPFVGHAMVFNEAGALWNLLGDSSFTGSSQLLNFGEIDSHGAALVSGLSGLANQGSIEVHSGSLTLDAAVSGTGNLTVGAGATLELASTVSSGQTVTFSSTTGMLVLDQAQDFHGAVAGLGTSDGTQADSDQIDLANINFNATSFSEQYNASTDTLSVSDGTHTASIQLIGSYSSANFNFVSDGKPIDGVAGSSGTIVYGPPVASEVNGSFVFAPTNAGPPVQYVIADFVEGLDRIDVRQFANLSAAALPISVQHGSDTLVTLDNHDMVWLKNFSASQLHASDFILHA